ncbi:ricin-type beta-trefoil lectin domain protein [Kitasatospora nipponensis]|uniref:Alpha-galactosidase n=1 Tax=Kitasatospora nipponensis TaxID=258049 RepID=A0ABN1W728_9ACTN
MSRHPLHPHALAGRGRVTAVAATAALLCSAAAVQLGAAPTAHALANTVALTPPMGWNTWNSFGCNPSEALIESSADRIVSSGMKAAGYQYVTVDDCWMSPDRDANGNLQADPAKFPHGMKAVADYVHTLGLKFGIYEVPTDRTCAQRNNVLPLGKNGLGTGSLGHEQQDATTFAAWGVDLLKYDWCSADGDLAYQQQQFSLMRDALAATGRPIVYSINPNSFHADKTGATFDWSGIANMWRTTEDITTSWNTGHTNSYAMGISNILNINGTATIADQSGPGHWNDPDMLEVGNGGLSADEQRSHLAMWALMSAPLMAGNKLASATPADFALLSNPDVIAVDQDPQGAGGRLINDTNGLQTWSKRLGDGSLAVVLLNQSSATATVSTTTGRLGLPSTASYALKDLWTGQSGTITTDLSASLAPHASAMYRITPTGPAATPAPPADGTYELASTGSSQVMDDPGSSTVANTQLIGYGRKNVTNQHWILTANGDGTYSVRNQASNLCVDIRGASTSAGAAVIQYGCSGSANQRFTPQPLPAGGFALVARNSGLAITAAGTTNGSGLTQQPIGASRADTQSWALNPTG